MIVRPAEPDDLADLVRMARLFCASINEEMDRETMGEFMIFLMEADTGALFVAADPDGPCFGMVAGMISPTFINRKRKFATELWWWMDEEARGHGVGKQLLNALESWAIDQGAEKLSMMALEAQGNVPALDSFYTSSGFRIAEHTWVKEL